MDVKPENIVLCKPAAYKKGTRLHFLYQRTVRDARVVEWLGAVQGSKHTLELEEYTKEDGSVVPACTVVTNLNECNHSTEHFDTAEGYEESRRRFCEQLRDDNEFVEDAITQQKLRIEEQYVLMRVIESTGEKARADWKRMDKVRDLVKLLVEPSADRFYGTHHAQPCLVAAGTSPWRISA